MTIHRSLWSCAWQQWRRQLHGPLSARRLISSAALEQQLSRPVQAYLSNSRDPYLNLSIEHYLLQKTAPGSAVLLLYVNRPSIIIGRNQNPWLEVNLALLNASGNRPETEPAGLGAVDLVRRRSGGGTVFHDEGNVNWTVISPSASFTRDKHAEMIVRALRRQGVDRARVNERHDIVLDQGQLGSSAGAGDTHATAYQTDETRPLKVSGSAYKLTRQRALHHGTCLLSSPNLNVIPHYLHSPAKPYLNARGVESVSSPVGNILLSNEAFIEATTQFFRDLYGSSDQPPVTEVGDDWLEIEDVHKGHDELKSLEWTFLQTPQFEFSSEPHDSANSAHLEDGPPARFDLTGKYGVITDVKYAGAEYGGDLVGKKIHEINDWNAALPSVGDGSVTNGRTGLVQWLQKMLPSVR
ncbi:hypothetical protein K431DRAFT_228492 [Polychaeton citri CBS 116435]|uniref:Putative lipoate-protein ligase A n=1 Tax=Polychaeton citri CBS 116435 TaxID=1314669 RepID=A0A9P4Q2R5_9PEZI|nr:hypothetical protein K431DRAFT_228492 [Polychaeton citri CBS 116435]